MDGGKTGLNVLIIALWGLNIFWRIIAAFKTVPRFHEDPDSP